MSEEATLDRFVGSDKNKSSEWEMRSLGNLAEYQNGKGFKKSEWGNEGYPIIRIQNLTGQQDAFNYYNGELDEKYEVKPGDTLLSWSATIDVFQWKGDNAALNQHIFRVDTSDEVNDTFYRFKLEHLLPRLVALSHGSTMQHVRKADLVNIDAKVPPLPEQRKIATVLNTVDRAIEKTEAIVQQSKQTKEGLVKQIVTGGIDAKKYQTMRVGPHEFEIPDHWDVVSISESCKNLDSERIPVSRSNREDMQGEIPYYGASGCVDYVDDYLFDEPLILLAEDGENLRSRTQRVAFKVTGKSWVNNHAHVLRPKDGFELDYLVEYLERLDYRPYVSGSAQPKLNQTMLNKITVPKPPLKKQKRIASILNEFKNQISYETEYLDQLARLKRGLMQDLLSGTVRTTDTNIEVPEEIAQYG